ncbi:hydroxysteroid 11-beta-dehydrogenase 1-like protein [Chanos chanos]|uniref:Hydroxysteroid 11-beta-dehydrogenase 1-like protein n=1 Tax=Chanos chanos TaxID=29144 RepID=A0A6J2W6V9_CHACN|nr:hydroxysteroid 11-beta-dehydrogenase 1-like protein [Chanos chanos]
MNTLVKLCLVGGLGAAFLAYQWSEPSLNVESLKGVRVLVTGASKGIGEQMAYHYARFGAHIVITGRTEKALQQVVKKCKELGAKKAEYIPADMSSTTDPFTVVEFALDKLGGLDHLVLNHIGITSFGLWDGDVEHVRWLLQVNFLSYLQMTKKALPALEESKGSIIVVSSMAGKIFTPFVAPYTATKSALNGFYGSLQHELAMQNRNVSITICTLGLIDTESAMRAVKGRTSLIPSPASEAAWQMIKGGALRQSEVFYPWTTYVYTFFRDWFPSQRDKIIRSSYHLEA